MLGRPVEDARLGERANSMNHGMSWMVLLLASIGVRYVSADDQHTLVGSRVRIETAGSAVPLVGVIADANPDSFLIETSSQGAAFRVSRNDIFGLEVSRGYRRRTWQGVAGGVLAWAAVVGLYAAFDTLDESGVGEPLFIGGLVAAGGVVGSLIKTERWEKVPVSRVSFRPSLHLRGVRAQVVLAF